MLYTEGLTFSYGQDTHFAFPNVAVGAGEVLLVLGPSGSGKTTLLHLLAGLMTPASGRIAIDEHSLSTLSGAKLDRFRGKNIGIVYQQAQFIRSISVIQNLLLAQTLSGGKSDRPKAEALLKELGVEHRMNALPTELSLGERQRAGIARALVNAPKVVLADEPTSALDDENCALVAQLLQRSAAGHGAALVIVTHDHRLKSLFPNSVSL